MRIFCEIDVYKLDNEEFKPGEEVFGLIRYAINEKIVFHKITVSLKGHGRLRIITKDRKNNREYTNREDFRLPENIPPSFVHCGNKGGYLIKCKIFYYIRIKFSRCGVLSVPKRFKKEIIVGGAFTPTLTRSPIIYGKQKKIVKLFSGNNTINIKADIENSVIKVGEIVTFGYEILNNKHVKLKGVKVKLMEVYSFKAKGLHSVKKFSNIEGFLSRTAAITGGGNQKLDFAIILPFDKKTIQYSKIVSRNYFLRIKVLFPIFRQNLTLDIPIEVGNEIGAEYMSLPPPPSYWEVMGECEKSKLFGDDDKFITDEEI
ncbi:uncharacterized protein LOC113515310 [Galleria mellonella]|uniref:Uncharacterized protein LOC113515310 n=1 Tax=Galleria mellonella TaxID=7137 RepID=A0A6J1WL55_GALME|nr:uncharacterized protein LOC113515310 [Galleria mellonella]